jgi:hypothetical protein
MGNKVCVPDSGNYCVAGFDGCGCIKQGVNKTPCANGLRDDGTSCWEDAVSSCPNDTNKIGGLCFDKCDDGYQYNTHATPGIVPVSCVPNNDRGPSYVQSDRKSPQCGNDREMVDGLCYLKCPNNLSRVPGAPTQCQGPRGISYSVNTAVPKIKNKGSHTASCNSNRELNNNLCYTKCADTFGDCYRVNPNAITECMPSKGLTYIPDIVGCPDGYIDNGASMCSNSYVPKTYAKKTMVAQCSGNLDQRLLGCYDKCPKMKISDGTDVQLKHDDIFPTQCVPPRGTIYPALTLTYVAPSYPKKRKIKMSTK